MSSASEHGCCVSSCSQGLRSSQGKNTYTHAHTTVTPALSRPARERRLGGSAQQHWRQCSSDRPHTLHYANTRARPICNKYVPTAALASLVASRPPPPPPLRAPPRPPPAAISVRSTAPNVALKGHRAHPACPPPSPREPRHACSNPYVRGATTSSSTRGHFGDRCDAAAV